MIKKFNLLFGVLAGIVISITGLPEKTGIVQAAEEVIINETNFPDEVFRNYIKTKIDQNKDNVLSDNEINLTKSIDIRAFNEYEKISDLHGIEYFKSLKVLRCDYNNLSILDVSQNKSLEILECDYNNLSALDVSQNINLKELFCGYNNLTELDIDKNLELTTLYCRCDNLTKLDVSKNKKLIQLDCTGKFPYIDLSKNSLLKEFQCYNDNLAKLDISNNTELITLSLSSNSLINLDISHNKLLKTLSCTGDHLEELDLSNNLELEKLYFECKSANLDVSKNTKLVYLTCWRSMLTNLDVRNNKLLKWLSYDGNAITELDLSNNPELIDLLGINNVDGTGNNLNKLILNKNTYGKLSLKTDRFYNGAYDFSELSNVIIKDGNIIVTDITKPATYKYKKKYIYNGDDGTIKDMEIIYTDGDTNSEKPLPTPSGNFVSPSCKYLFKNYNYASPVSGSPVIIYGNGGTFKTGTTKTTNKQFTAYTDILASYNYTVNAKGVVKPSAGKVIAGITKSPVKPVVTKNKIIDKDAAKIARAKIKNGQVTVTAAGKEKGLVYLWIIDTGSKGVYESCPINVLLAPRKIEVHDKSGNKLKNSKLENGKTLDVNITGISSGNTKTDDCTYTATVAQNSQSYINVVPSGNSGKEFKITATGLKNNKSTKAIVVFQCNENGKKTKFSLTITE